MDNLQETRYQSQEDQGQVLDAFLYPDGCLFFLFAGQLIIRAGNDDAASRDNNASLDCG
jgi:hypothetical protein